MSLLLQWLHVFGMYVQGKNLYSTVPNFNPGASDLLKYFQLDTVTLNSCIMGFFRIFMSYIGWLRDFSFILFMPLHEVFYARTGHQMPASKINTKALRSLNQGVSQWSKVRLFKLLSIAPCIPPSSLFLVQALTYKPYGKDSCNFKEAYILLRFCFVNKNGNRLFEILYHKEW